MNESPQPAQREDETSQSMARLLLAELAIVLAGALVYANSFHGEFVFDDPASIAENPAIRQLWPLWPVLTSSSAGTIAGRPVLKLSLALNYAWGGLDVRGYHAFNLIVHLLAALTLFGIVRRTLSLGDMPAALRRDAAWLALAAALIWTVHPLQTESVTYIVQRAESLGGLFYLLVLYCAIRGATARRPGPWYAGSGLACLLGVATKELVATAPLVVLAYDRIFLTRSLRESMGRRWGLYLALGASWILQAVLMAGAKPQAGSYDHLTCFWLSIKALALGQDAPAELAGFDGLRGWRDYLLTQFGAVTGYLRLAFWPHPLMIDYGMPVAKWPSEVLPYALAIAALLTATLIALWYWPKLGFLGLWFFAILAPTSIVPLVTQPIAEHRMYLPLAAVATLTTLALYFACRRWLHRGAGDSLSTSPFAGIALPAILAVMLAALGYLTYQRNKDYRTAIALYSDNIRKNPSNPRCWILRGDAHFRARHYALALNDYRPEIRMAGEAAQPILFKRAEALEKLGRSEEALQEYTQALETNPNSLGTLMARGLLYKRLGNFSAAEADLTRVLDKSPDQFDAYGHRGDCFRLEGKFEQALADYSRLLEQQPASVEALCNRGTAHGQLGQTKQAIADFTKAIEFAPQQVVAYQNRAVAYYQAGDFERARADLRTVEQLGGQPSDELLRRLNSANRQP